MLMLVLIDAIDIAHKAKNLCSKFGINLHKFASNNSEVIEAISVKDRADGLKNLDLDLSLENEIERTLGVGWCIDNDSFFFKIALKKQPITRRGILSSVSAIYDPLGFLCPVIISGKMEQG